VVRGWVKAYAPAFEDGDVTSVLPTTAGCGFREGISLVLVPTPEQARAFLDSREPDKRHRLIDALLGLGPLETAGYRSVRAGWSECPSDPLAVLRRGRAAARTAPCSPC
jgi:hypothetical protein